MIIKKLAVPLINEKLLQQAEHCYIATAAMSEAGFDFIRSRIPPKCKMEIVTGLDAPTSPQALRRIWRNYQGRITLNIYTRNFFHANLYIFDLPFRKAVAFVGSGQFTLEGIKDSEELFYKVTDAKEIENLKSWFIGYYEFAEPLSEELIQEYEWRYPIMKQREILSRQEKEQLLVLTTGGFSWDHIKFKNQCFKKEDYLALSRGKALFTTPAIQEERVSVQTKLLQLHESLKKHVNGLKLYEHSDSNHIVSGLDPANHADGKVRSLSISYGRSEAELKKTGPTSMLIDFMTAQIILQQHALGNWLVPGNSNAGQVDREYFKDKMNDVEYRTQFFKLLKGLGAGYWIEIVGDKVPVEKFQNEEALWEFTKADQWRYYSFVIGKNYAPGDSEISRDNIVETITKAFEKLGLLYHHMKRPEV